MIQMDYLMWSKDYEASENQQDETEMKSLTVIECKSGRVT